MIGADDQPGGLEHAEYRQGLDACIAHGGASNLIKSGMYQTVEGLPVTCRIHRMQDGTAAGFNGCHLLGDTHVALGHCNPACLGEIFEVNAGVTEIVRTAGLSRVAALGNHDRPASTAA